MTPRDELLAALTTERFTHHTRTVVDHRGPLPPPEPLPEVDQLRQAARRRELEDTS